MAQRRWPAMIALLLAAAIPCVGYTVGPARPMTYRWSGGETRRYRLSAKLSGSLPIMQSVEPMELDGSLEIVYKVAVRSVDRAGSAGIEMRVESAEAELARIPLPVPLEDAQRILNRSATFAADGSVTSVAAAPDLPFTLSIPGVDPQRFYAFVCPVVFPRGPVRPGDTWEYRSELMGSDGAPARFTATVLDPEAPTPQRSSAARRSSEGPVRVRQEFALDVDQRLGADKKPAPSGEPVRLTRTGRITGTGVMAFSRAEGRLLRGHLTIQANITERALGEVAEGTPAETASRVKAVISVAPIAPKTTPSKAGRPARGGASGRKP